MRAIEDDDDIIDVDEPIKAKPIVYKPQDVDLDLHIHGCELTIAQFAMQIESFLKLGADLGVITYKITTRQALEDDIPVPEIRYTSKAHRIVMTPEIEEYVKALGEKGWNAGQIASKTGMYVKTAQNILIKYGVIEKNRINEATPETLKDEFVDRFVKDGWSPVKIAEHYNTTSRTVAKWLEKRGVYKKISKEEVNSKIAQFHKLAK